MEDTAREQKGAVTVDPVIQVFATAIADTVASCAARSRPEVEHSVVCCAMDYVWAEELAHPRYHVRFERPTTLAVGDDACRFRFFKSSST